MRSEKEIREKLKEITAPVPEHIRWRKIQHEETEKFYWEKALNWVLNESSYGKRGKQ